MFEDMQNWVNEHLSSPWIKFAIAITIGMFVGLFVAGVLRVLANRSKRKLLSTIAANLRTAIFIIFTLLGINFGLQAFDFRPDTLFKISNGFTFALFILATWALTNVYDSFHEHVFMKWAKKTDNVSIVEVGHTLGVLTIWMIGLITALSSAGFNVSAVLAGVGLGGLAIALAAQDAVANIFGGVIILTQTPFRVGDKITINGTTAWVTNIGIRSTTMVNWYGHTVTMPNKVFTSSAVANVDARKEYWEEIQLKLRHDTTIAQVETAVARVKKILTDHEHLREAIWVGVCKIGEGFLQIEVWYGIISYIHDDGKADFANEYAKILDVKSDVHIQILRALEEEDIRLATPVATHINHEGPMTAGRF